MARLRCLDGLRGVLAVYVMLSHMAPFSVLPGWLQSALSHGAAGVDAFFVLSGLVIVQSLQAHGYDRRRFLAARAWRIFPVYLPVFGLAVAVQALDLRIGPGMWEALPWVGPDSPARTSWSFGWPADWQASLLAHLTMTHGLFPDAVLPDAWNGFLGAAWSLSTEWQFYALAALVAPWLRRRSLGLFGFAALLLALAAAGAAWALAAPPGFGFSRAFLPNAAQYFALGVASAALLARFGLNAPGEARAGERAAWMAFLAVLGATLLLCLVNEVGKLAVPLLWPVCLAAQCLPRRTGTGWLGWLLTRRVTLWLGAVSYPLYLVHAPVQKLLGRALAGAADGRGTWFSVIWVPAALLLPIGLAWLLHVWIEVPGMQRFRGRRAGAPPALAPLGVAPAAPDSLFAAPGWISQIRFRKPRTPMPRSPTG